MTGSIVAPAQLIARTGRYRIFPIIGSVLMVLALVPVRADRRRHPAVAGHADHGADGPRPRRQHAADDHWPCRTPSRRGRSAWPPQSVTFFRSMGGTLGTAVFLSVLFNGCPARSAAPCDGRAPRPIRRWPQPLQSRPAATATAADLNDTSFIKQLPDVLAHPFKVGFSDGIDRGLPDGPAVMVIGLFVVLFLPEIPLSDKSGIQAPAPEAGEDPAPRSPRTSRPTSRSSRSALRHRRRLAPPSGTAEDPRR